MELLSTFFKAAGFEEVPATRTYTREDLIRVVIAQQWAVAIACHDEWGHIRSVAALTCAMSKLPCAVDVVDGTIDAADAALEKKP
jgi:hypothetical protein